MFYPGAWCNMKLVCQIDFMKHVNTESVNDSMLYHFQVTKTDKTILNILLFR